MSSIDLSYFDRNHFIVFPKPPLRPVNSQDVKHGIIVSGLDTSLWGDFLESIECEFDGDYDPTEEKLCIYFHKGPRLDEAIWNRVWAFTDDGRPLELAKLDVAIVPRSTRAPSTRVSSDVSSLVGVSAFLSDLTSEPPPSRVSRLSMRDQCRPLPRFLTEITPNESVSQISSEDDPSIPSDAVSLISRAEKDELQWKAKKLDAITRELRAIQIGSKAGLSTATIRDILGHDLPIQPQSPKLSPTTDLTLQETATSSLLSLATSTAIPALLTITLVTLSLHASSPTSPFPPLRQLHHLLTSSGSNAPSAATVIYRTAKPMTGLSPHNLTFLVPFLVVGSAVVGWNVLCQEMGIEFGVFGKAGIIGKFLGGVDEGFEVDWDGVREFFGMIEG